MKKLATLLSCCALSLAAAAQDNGQTNGPLGARSSADYAPGSSNSRNNGFGVKAGFNLADLNGQETDSYRNLESLKTYHAGIYAQFGFSDKFSIQPEFLFSRKGFKAQSFTPITGQPTGTSEQVRLDYLQVPVLLVYNIVDNVSVHVGPQASLLVKAKYGTRERRVGDVGLNSLEYGVVGGAEARVGPARLGARYDLGLSDIYNDPKDAGAAAYDNVKNGVFQVYIGFGFSS